ncbi:helix-turn-helix transcriptional regulator [Salinibacterium hongtaonis]|nr:LuxR C-terminal-related transcriptional regulator [Salinibacterium hongtaonis]
MGEVAVVRSSPVVRSLRCALALLGASSIALGSALLNLAVDPVAAAGVALYAVVVCIYLAAGILAWWRRPGNRMGALIVLAGFAVLAAGLSNSLNLQLMVVGTISATVVLALTVHLLHAFPSGRIQGRASRWIVFAAYANSLVLEAPGYLFDPGAQSPLFVSDLPGLAATASALQSVIGVAVAIGTAIVLVSRLRAADAARRRTLVPLFAYGMLAILFIPFSSVVLEGFFGVDSYWRGIAQLVVIGGVPIAFTLGILRGGFARTAGLSELETWLGASGGEPSALTAALARTIGDPDLQVAYWVEDRGIHVDETGAAVALPGGRGHRTAVAVELDGRRIAAIIYNSELIADSESVRSAGRLVALTLDRERLTAELHASERALAASRARVEMADATTFDSDSGIERLTRRQREVLALIAQGRTNAAIARELVLTEKSVVNHISRIFDALNLPMVPDDHRRVIAAIRYLAR